MPHVRSKEHPLPFSPDPLSLSLAFPLVSTLTPEGIDKSVDVGSSTSPYSRVGVTATLRPLAQITDRLPTSSSSLADSVGERPSPEPGIKDIALFTELMIFSGSAICFYRSRQEQWL